MVTVSPALTAIRAENDVPVADAVTNLKDRDVIGNKTDAAQTTVGTTRSLMGYLKGVLSLIVSYLKSTTVLHECTYPEVSLTGSGVANTYGAYAQIHAAPGYDIEVIGVFVSPNGGTAGNTVAVEIAKGAAASEVPIATVPFMIRTEGYYFPFPSPILVTNQRLAARTKNEGTSGGANVMAVWRKVS